MFQRTSKKIFGLAMSATMLANMVAMPVLAKNDRPTSTRPGKTVVNFCTRLDNATTKLDNNLADRAKKLSNKRMERDARLEKNRSARDEKIAQHKTDADKKRAEHYAKMQTKVKNPAQDQALANFQAAISAAVSARKAAFDAARTTFRAGMDAALATRKTAIDGAINTFQAALEAAKTQAKTDCANGVDPATAKATFQATVKAAREKLAADRKAVENISASVKDLVNARRAAMDKARADFKAATEKARKDLKAALAAAKTSPTTTTTP